MSEMQKTSTKLCKTCKYGIHGSSDYINCDFYLKTDIRRGCKVGECDKYESKLKKEKGKSKDYFFGKGKKKNESKRLSEPSEED